MILFISDDKKFDETHYSYCHGNSIAIVTVLVAIVTALVTMVTYKRLRKWSVLAPRVVEIVVAMTAHV